MGVVFQVGLGPTGCGYLLWSIVVSGLLSWSLVLRFLEGACSAGATVLDGCQFVVSHVSS